MTCTEALALARRGEHARATAHIDVCTSCKTALERDGHALTVARTVLAIEVPVGHADRTIRAALAAPPALSVWRLALPITWPAAAALNLAGLIALVWILTRGSPISVLPEPTSTGVDDLFGDELDALLAGDLDGEDGQP
jgi:hypothetical protein